MSYKTWLTVAVISSFLFTFPSAQASFPDFAPIKCQSDDNCFITPNTQQELHNEQVVQGFYADVINQRNLSHVGRYLSKTFVYNGQQRGLSGQIQALQFFLKAFHPLQNKIIFMMAQGNFVVIRQVWQGTQTGSFLGVPNSGKSIQWTSNAIIQMNNNFMQREWIEEDFLTLFEEMGAYPAMNSYQTLPGE
jgi:predicted ester cyclase